MLFLLLVVVVVVLASGAVCASDFDKFRTDTHEHLNNEAGASASDLDVDVEVDMDADVDVDVDLDVDLAEGATRQRLVGLSRPGGGRCCWGHQSVNAVAFLACACAQFEFDGFCATGGGLAKAWQQQQEQQAPQKQYATVKSRAAWLAQRCRRRGSSIN